jgi:hypothetical protein
MLGVSSVPTNLKIYYQNNLLSLSLTIVFENLCNQNTSLKNNSTTSVVEYLEGMENKCANFMSLSTTT